MTRRGGGGGDETQLRLTGYLLLGALGPPTVLSSPSPVGAHMGWLLRLLALISRHDDDDGATFSVEETLEMNECIDLFRDLLLFVYH